MFAAKEAGPGDVLIATVEGLIQKTIPYKEFNQKTLPLEVGSTLPSNFNQFLATLGYQAVPTVEDVGTYCLRGGIIDIFSPAHEMPIRIELFGDSIESIRFFELATQLTSEQIRQAHIIPTKEALFSDENRQRIVSRMTKDAENRPVEAAELTELVRSASMGQYFYGSDFLLPYFYEKLSAPVEYFSSPIHFWVFDRSQCLRYSDQFIAKQKSEFEEAKSLTLRINYSNIFSAFQNIELPEDSKYISIESVDMVESSNENATISDFNTYSVKDFSAQIQSVKDDPDRLSAFISDKIRGWRQQNYSIFLVAANQSLAQRLQLLLERADQKPEIYEQPSQWQELILKQKNKP